MRRVALIERETTNVVIGCFFEVYNTLGYGFLEHVYGLALERELMARGRNVSREVSIPVRYKGTFSHRSASTSSWTRRS